MGLRHSQTALSCRQPRLMDGRWYQDRYPVGFRDLARLQAHRTLTANNDGTGQIRAFHQGDVDYQY